MELTLVFSITMPKVCLVANRYRMIKSHNVGCTTLNIVFSVNDISCHFGNFLMILLINKSTSIVMGN